MESEKERMLSGKPYKAFDKELENERLRARILREITEVDRKYYYKKLRLDEG